MTIDERTPYDKQLEFVQKSFIAIPKHLRGKKTLAILSTLLPLRQMCSGGRQDIPKEKKHNQFECPVCNEIATDAVQSTKCGHVYCRECITNLLAQSTGTEPCPDDSCEQELTIKQIKSVQDKATGAAAAGPGHGLSAHKQQRADALQETIKWMESALASNRRLSSYPRKVPPCATPPSHVLVATSVFPPMPALPQLCPRSVALEDVVLF